MCSDAPKPPDMRPMADAMREVGSRMEALGREQLQFGQRRYDETLPFYQQMIQSNLEGQRMSMRLASEAERDRQKYRGLEDQMVSEAQNQDRTAVRNQMAGRAASDVEQATSAARSSAARSLIRMGINPNAARFADLNNQITMQSAATRAGAMNNARMAADQVVDAKRMNAISLGRNLPATMLSAVGAGAGAGGATAGLFDAQSNPILRGYSGAMSGLQGNLGAINGSAGILNQGYQNELAAYNAEGGALGALGSLVGTGLGMYKTFMADGGRVTGPGTGTSDSVRALNTDTGEPIMLSNGEYVLPADTVRKVGQKALDKLVEKTHTPVRKSAIRRN